MSETYPYPVAEHYQEPRNPLEVLDEELRLYPDGPSLRGGIIAIGRIYQESDILYGFKKFAYLVNVAQVTAGNTEPTKGIDNDFYAGSILGTHVMLKPAPRVLRQDLLHTDFLMEYSPWVENHDENNQELREAVEELGVYRGGEWQELFGMQPIEHQERVIEAAVRMYEDIPQAGEREDSFMAGYMHAVNIIYGSISDTD